MGKLLTDAGGTRAWRRRVQEILDRDGRVCQMMRDGHRCGARATTANHIVPRALGGGDEKSNLEAACVPCNMAAGAALVARLAAQQGHDAIVVVALVRLLDAIGVPVDAGRRQARKALARRGEHPWTAGQLDAACAYRRGRGPLTRI